MNGPNKTVANFRRKSGPSHAAISARNERMFASSPMKDIMNAVSRGEITPEEGVIKIKQMMEMK